jgi:hypothetical protein
MQPTDMFRVEAVGHDDEGPERRFFKLTLTDGSAVDAMCDRWAISDDRTRVLSYWAGPDYALLRAACGLRRRGRGARWCTTASWRNAGTGNEPNGASGKRRRRIWVPALGQGRSAAFLGMMSRPFTELGAT